MKAFAGKLQVLLVFGEMVKPYHVKNSDAVSGWLCAIVLVNRSGKKLFVVR